MTSDYIPAPPSGYVYSRDLFADWNDNLSGVWLYAWANLLALIPLGVGILILWIPYQLYLAMGSPLAMWPHLQLSKPLPIIAGVAIVLTSMLAHELLHGLSLTLMGYRPVLSFSEGFLWAGLRTGMYLTRRHYLIMGLTPLLTMTVSGGVMLYFLPPALGQPVLIALLLNMAGSVGDLLVARRVWQCPPDALFTDDKGIRVFVPEGASEGALSLAMLEKEKTVS